MPRFRFLIVIVLAGCSLGRHSPLPSTKSRGTVTAAFLDDDQVVIAQPAGRHCSLVAASQRGSSQDLRESRVCPTDIQRLEGNSGMLLAGSTSQWLRNGEVTPAGGVIAAVSRDEFVVRTGSELFWVQGDGRVRLPADLETVKISLTKTFAVATRRGRGELIRVARDGRTAALFTDPSVSAIDSFDIDPKGMEVAFSAKRPGGYDIAIVSSDGGAPRWVAPDPADERMVRWAPRGNKISYVISTFGGSTIRTVHLPTSYQLAVSLPFSHVTGLAWQPKAERFAVTLSSPIESSHVSSMKYSGEERVDVTHGDRIAADLDQLPGRSEAVMRPPLTYGARLPAAIVFEGDSPFEWSAAAAAIYRAAPTVVVRASATDAVRSDEIVAAVRSLQYVDPARIALVGANGMPQGAGVSSVHPDEGRYNGRAVQAELRRTR